MSEEIHQSEPEPRPAASLAAVGQEERESSSDGAGSRTTSETTEGTTATPPRRPRRRRGGARGGGNARAKDSATTPADSVPQLISPDGESAPGDGPTQEAQGDGAAQTESGAAPRPRRRRRSRSGSRAGSASGTAPGTATGGSSLEAVQVPTEQSVSANGELEAPPQPADATESAAKPAARRRRRRRGRRGGSRSTGELEERVGEDLEVEGSESADSADTVTDARPPKTKKPASVTRIRAKSTGPRRRRERPPQIKRVTDKVMLITEIGDRDQIAVLEGRDLVEHYITRSGAHSMVGNVYLGKVQNVLPGMEAAFVDVGRGRNAVLYAGEVAYDEDVEGGETPRIEEVLKPGHNVLVQVTKDPMGGKGARLTQEVSLPGRFLVLVPNSDVFGISRRLPERERARLKDILKKVRPPEHGLIVRTAAEGASPEDLGADLDRLTEGWAQIEKSAKRGKAPRMLYEEPELTIRVVRDVFTGGEFKELITDSGEVFDRVHGYLQEVAPELAGRVRKHEGKLPLLEEHHVVEQIHKALERKVWLPSGGYIVIDRSEAMTVIDVNTGKHVGTANLEETVTKTNTEAADEIARQLRLRDIGGIIIIDFIDMLFERNRDKVIQTLKDALAQDKTRSQVFDITPLGLLEVTRKRVSAGLVESFSETCPTCEGRGIVLTYKL